MKPEVIRAAFLRQTKNIRLCDFAGYNKAKPLSHKAVWSQERGDCQHLGRSADSWWRHIAPGQPVEGGWSLPNPLGFAGHTAWTFEIISFSLVPNLPAVLGALASVPATVSLECKSHGAPLNYVVLLHCCYVNPNSVQLLGEGNFLW